MRHSSPSVSVITGKGIESFPFFDFVHHRARVVRLYHYTDREGFQGLTASRVEWLPSLGATTELVSTYPFPGREDLFPSEAERSPPSISSEISSALSALVLMIASGPSREMVDLSSLVYGPGWYLTDLPPTTSTDALLRSLWGGNPAKRDRTAFWVAVTLSEFKVRTPDLSRPKVKFVPIRDKIGESAEGSLFGQSFSVVTLVSGGTRTETVDGRIRVKRLYRKRTTLIPSLQFLIEGWSQMEEDARDRVLSYFGIHKRKKWAKDSAEGSAIDRVHSLAQNGEFRKALEVVDEALGRYPDVADLWSNRGVVLAKLNRRREAVECYVRALQLQPDYRDARRNLTASLILLGRTAESLSCVNELISDYPDYADAWYNRGLCLMKLNEWEAATRSFEQFVELAPEHDRAERVRGRIRYCRMQSLISWPKQKLRGLSGLWSRW